MLVPMNQGIEMNSAKVLKQVHGQAGTFLMMIRMMMMNCIGETKKWLPNKSELRLS